MQEILLAIWHHDFETLQQVSSLKWFILLLALVLYLESSFVFLPLPGDSLMLFAGGMIGLGIIDFYSTATVLCIAASTGSFCAYLQGRVLHKTPLIFYLERILPDNSLPKARHLLNRYGFLSLFISRFIPFVRVLTPMLMGIAKLSVWRTAVISASSSFIWCLILLLTGKWIMLSPIFSDYQETLSKGFVVATFSLMLIAISGVIYRLITNKKSNQIA